MSGRPGAVMVGGRRRAKAWGGGLLLVVVVAAAVFLGLRFATDSLDMITNPEQETTPDEETGPPAEAISVAEDFLAAWEAGDWEQLQGLTADQDLDAAAIHSDADRILRITDASYSLGEPELDEDGDVEIPFDAEWELEGLGSVAFSSEMTVRMVGGPAGNEDAEGEPTNTNAAADGEYRVAWWYDVVHPHMTSERRFQRVREHQERGAIMAADGTPLVETADMIELGIVRGDILDREIVSGVLAEVTGDPQGEIRAVMDDDSIDAEEFHALTTMSQEEYEAAQPELAPHAGVETRNTITRTGDVPQSMQRYIGRTGEITAELLDELDGNYISGDVVGLSGLERAYERHLAGEATEEAMIVDATGLVESLIFVEGSEPQDLQTTFVPEIQLAAEEVAGGVGNPTAIVAVHTGSSEVLGAVSTPFDEFDRALAGGYAPGSTFKIVTAAGMLAEGMDPADQVSCPGSQQFGELTLSNAGGFSLGGTNFLTSFARSCNTTFGQLATELGTDGMMSVTEQFGFGVDYPVGIAAQGGSYPQPESPPELAMSGIGQARVTTSPMHMASVAAAVPSGTWQSPHVVRELSDRPEPVELDGALEPALIDMMREVITNGTGSALNIGGEPVYGKTGTAEYEEGDSLGNHAWMVGWRTDVAFAVLVEGGGGGGSVAGPVAASFLQAIEGIAVPGAEPEDEEQPEPEIEADTPAQDEDITEPENGLEDEPEEPEEGEDDDGDDDEPEDAGEDGESPDLEDVLTAPDS